MNPRRNFARLALPLVLAITLLPLATVAQGAKIRMPDFSGLAEKASESVDISLEGEQLRNVGSMFGGGKGSPDEAQFAEMLKGVQGIHVTVFEFDKPGQYSMRDIETVVRQVEREGWKKIMSMRDEEDRVELWMRDGHEDGGMFFVASEPDELVLINIVGNVNLQVITQLGGRMGVPNLSGILGSPAPPAAPAAPARPAQPAQPAQPRAQ